MAARDHPRAGLRFRPGLGLRSRSGRPARRRERRNHQRARGGGRGGATGEAPAGPYAAIPPAAGARGVEPESALVEGAEDLSDGPLEENRLVAYYGTPQSEYRGVPARATRQKRWRNQRSRPRSTRRRTLRVRRFRPSSGTPGSPRRTARCRSWTKIGPSSRTGSHEPAVPGASLRPPRDRRRVRRVSPGGYRAKTSAA